MKVMKWILLLVAIITIYFIYKNNVFPSHIGLENGRFKELPGSPNGVSSQTEYESLQVEPLVLDTNQLDQLEKIIIEMKGDIVTKKADYWHVVFTTPLMRYKDDLELHFINGLVEYKSSSRVGYSDMGLNKERYLEIKDKLETLE